MTEQQIQQAERNTDTGDGIESLESQYQTEKLLTEGTDVQAEIVDVGFVEEPLTGKIADIATFDSLFRVFLVIDLIGGGQYAVRINRFYDHENRGDLVSLYQGLGLRPTADLRILEGKTVTVTIDDSGYDDRIILHAGRNRIETSRVDREDVRNSSIQLPARFATVLGQAFEYAQRGEEAPPVMVRNLRRDDDQLTLHLEGGWGTIEVDITDHGRDSPYTRLVEDVGQGSVREIEGSEIYVRHFDDITFPDHVMDTEQFEQELEGMTLAEMGSFSAWNSSEQEYLEKYHSGYVTTMQSRLGKFAIYSEEPSTEYSPEAIVGFGFAGLVVVGSFITQSGPMFIAGLAIAVAVFLILPFIHSAEEA